MSSDPPKDEGLELLLQEIAKNLDENQRFMKALQEDRIDDLDDPSVADEREEPFEEL